MSDPRPPIHLTNDDWPPIHAPSTVNCAGRDCRDAADEITRLRAENERLSARFEDLGKNYAELFQKYESKSAENERLTRESNHAREAYEQWAKLFSEEQIRAEAAERERDEAIAAQRVAELGIKNAQQREEASVDRANAAERKVERLREALEPFSKLRATRFMTNGIRYEFRIDAAWIRQADAAFKETGPEKSDV